MHDKLSIVKILNFAGVKDNFIGLRIFLNYGLILRYMDTLTSKAASLQPWIVTFSAALFFFYEFIQMNMFNAISPELMQAFGITATQLGNLAATYLYATVLALFPVGLLLDRFSTKKLILIAFSVCVMGTILFASSISLLMAQVCRFIAGLGGAFCFLSCLVLASRWFPTRKMALVTGLLVTVAMIGGAVAQTPLTLLVQALGWRVALYIDAILGMIFIGVIWRFVEDSPNMRASRPRSQDSYPLGFWRSVGLALRNLQNWLAGIYTCLLNLPVLLLGALWGGLYLTQVHQITRTQASLVTTMIFFGTILGSPLMGWISDRLGQRRIPMLLGASLGLPIILIIMMHPNLTFTELMILFFALGFFTSTQILCYPLVAESNSVQLTGAAEGVTCALVMSGGAIFQPVFGWLMDVNWDGKIIAGIPVYTLQNFRMALMILPIAFIMCLISAFYIKETNCQALHISQPNPVV